MRILAVVIGVLLLAIQYPLWFGKGGWLRVHELERQLAAQRATNAVLAARNADAAAELTIGLMLSLARHIPQSHAALKRGEFTRAENATHRKASWSVTVNETEMRELPATSVATGSFLPWKEAMWGSFRDGKLLQRVAKRFPSLAVFAKEHELLIHKATLMASGFEGITW